MALTFMALTFCRPGEIVNSEWAEMDFTNRLWRIPASKMKMSRDHIVPLSPQALAVLEVMRPYAGEGGLVFPGHKTKSLTLARETLVAALRRMGFGKDEVCAHGFRAMASTLLNELGYPPDVIERQLAHAGSLAGNAARTDGVLDHQPPQRFHRAFALVPAGLSRRDRACRTYKRKTPKRH